MFKKFLILFVLSSFVFCIFASKSLAKNISEDKDLPEVEGTYNVPGKPDLKLRVFVYRPKDVKPSPSPSPVILICPSDSASTAVVPGAGWSLPASWTYTLNKEIVPVSVGGNNLSSISSLSFNAWVNALDPNKVNITPTSSMTSINRAKLDNQNIIAWGRTSGSALAVTYTWYSQLTGKATEIDTIMNQKFNWYWNLPNNMCTDKDSYDAQDILTHELGHWMGLDDVYTPEYTENTMYGYGSKGETKKDTLTEGDITGVRALY